MALLFLLASIQDGSFAYQKWIWFVWFTNFLASFTLLILQILECFLKTPTEFKNAFRSIFILIAMTFAHLILGAFLSFFAQMEPLAFFGPNGYINHFDMLLFFEKLSPFPDIFWLYLCTKLFLIQAQPSRKFSGFTYIADPIILLISGIALPLLFLALGMDLTKPPVDWTIKAGLMTLMFIPFHKFFSGDVRSLIDDQVAHVKPDQMQFPMTVVARGAKGWGLFFAAMGGLFVSVSLFIAKQSLKVFLNGSFGQAVGLAFGFLMFFAFGSIFILVGLNLNWSYKKVRIDNHAISFEQKVFLPWPKIKEWSVSRIEYHVPEKVVRRVKQSDGPSYSYNAYRIILRRKKEFIKSHNLSFTDKLFTSTEVLLYEAYFEKNIDDILNRFRFLF